MTANKTDEMKIILANALNAKGKPVPPNMSLACARVYVTVYGKHLRVVKAAAAKLGLRWTHRGIYVGYDNATGIEYMRGEAIAEALKAHGIDCYQHTDED